jgi:maltose alpha-D-glucosyltransferase/alpha-amylase
MAPNGPISDLQWHRDAIFYEVPVKSFFDADGDGVGDFPGLMSKLDYLQELGVTCLWLLPFYPSPLRDDGYDVSDYRGVHPPYGTADDFRMFLGEAHRRGLRVAAEMVINHTSDQHPWFQAARSAPPGSPLRDFFVWADDDRRLAGAGAPDHDGQRSHWTWDPEARAFYFHSFFSHQPDLNYDRPAVRDEVRKVLRFWLEMGVDGLCLNGAAYLFKRDGTPSEHLAETHAFLKEVRRELDAAYPGRMLQAGVSAWPAEAARYFGDGDEAHMVPNLPLAQRLFLALRQEDRHPVADLLRQTPAPPDGCQWVVLLRNHDELTLALATDEERDYMYREYAADPRTLRHGGILRRLAPMVDNNRRRLELLFGLLFSLPGAPLLYYGDEIGMGDNPYLGGRAGVRTPMQWSADRHAGFSDADFARLFAPPVLDPIYGCRAVNVEAQRRDPSSLYHWLRRLIALRKRTPALACGSLEPLEPANRKVLAVLRRLGDEIILVAANLSRSAQPAELDLSAFAGLVPVEWSGRTAFPRVGANPYVLTLGPHDLYWFSLRKSAEEAPTLRAAPQLEEVESLPAVEVAGDWDGVLEGARVALEGSVLPGYLRSQRWFGGKARRVESVHLEDWGGLPGGSGRTFWALLDVWFADGASDLYLLPVGVADGPAAVRMVESMRPWVLATLHGPAGEAVLHDALADDAACTAILNAIGDQREFVTQQGRIRGVPTAAFARLRGDASRRLPVVRGPATSSNSLVFYGRRLVLKLFRRLEVGVNPDMEVGRFLTEESPFGRTPATAGGLEYQRPGSPPMSLAIVQALAPNQGDGWRHAIDELGRYYDRASGRMHGPDPLPPDPRRLAELVDAIPPPGALEIIDGWLHTAAVLGRRTAEMHLALCATGGLSARALGEVETRADKPPVAHTLDPAFVPEPVTDADLAALRNEIAGQARRALAALRDNLDRLQAQVQLAAAPLMHDADLPERAGRSVPDHVAAAKIRCHGDYHLGQVLWVENDFVILDFEGEPTRTVEERRAKQSPLKDVAGMLRSFDYAAHAGLFAFTHSRPDDFFRLTPWADLWRQWVSAAFLRAYRDAAGPAPFMPAEQERFTALLDAFLLGKAFYELAYELNNRPDWVRIPLWGVLSLLGLGPA